MLKHNAYISLEASAQASLVKFVREKRTEKIELAKQKRSKDSPRRKKESESESEEQDG